MADGSEDGISQEGQRPVSFAVADLAGAAGVQRIRNVLAQTDWLAPQPEFSAADEDSEHAPLLPKQLHDMLAADTSKNPVHLAAQYIQVALTGHKMALGGLSPLQESLFRLRRKWWYQLFVRLNILMQLSLVVIEPASFRTRENSHAQYLAEVIIGGVSVLVQMFDVWVRFWPYGRSHMKEPWNVINALCVLLNGADILCRLFNVTTLQFSRPTRPLLLIAQSRRLRRTVTIILRSLPSVLGILWMFALVIFCFAYLGVVLFYGQYTYPPGSIPTDNFDSFGAATFAMFDLVTTENYPAVLYPAFSVSQWSFAFFFFFCAVHIVLMSLMLGNIYDVLLDEHKNHVKGALIRERRNVYLAFHCIDRDQNGVVSLDEWDDLMAICTLFHIRPRMPRAPANLPFACFVA